MVYHFIFFLTVEGLHLMPLFFHPLASCLGEFERVWLTIFTSILSCLGKQTYFLRYSPRLLSSLCSKLIFLLISVTEYLETKFHDYFPLAWRGFLEINLMKNPGNPFLHPWCFRGQSRVDLQGRRACICTLRVSCQL